MDEASIFLEALKKPSAGACAAFLDQACGSNDELRRSVELLLRAHEKAGGFLADSPAPAGITVDQPIPERAGTVIGPYKLLEQVGEGGMGSVWMAQQQEPVKRLVAVKLIKAGMDSKQVLARFEAERQALALMDHSNIARVLDGGSTGAGRPYFVMELVKGVPITRYCDAHRLTPRQRLELFVSVCQAVQHAHQKGIIHRDLKPSNVLVALSDGKPVPKVIDFGVAKAAGQSLTDKTLVTGFGNIIGTLEYMSPEQAEINQLDVDTRSDIYSLGVLLYELLTGSPPFRRQELEEAGMLEMLRVIREQEPTRPSTRLSTSDGLPALAANRGTEPAKLTRLVRGELDWIVMKALEKDRNRRYETANGFALDVLRYLADEPVLACPPSLGYRLRKFTRRNKRATVMASVIGTALLLSVGSLGWVVRDREAGRVRTTVEVNQFLQQGESLYADNKLPEAFVEVQKARGVLEAGRGDEQLRQRVRQWLTDLETAAKLEEIRLEGYDLEDRDRWYADHARVFREYGIDVETLSTEEVTARVAASQIKLDLVLALGNWAARLRSDPRAQDPAPWQRLLVISRTADADPWRHRLQAAVEAKDLQALRELANKADPASMRSRSLAHLGLSLRTAGDAKAAVDFLRKAQRQHPGDFSINSNLATCLEGLMPPPWDEVIAFRRAAVAVRPKSAWAHHILGVALQNKDLDEAIVEQREAIRLRPGYPYAHNSLGVALHAQRKLHQAIAEYRKAISIAPNFVIACNNLGTALRDQKKLDEAIEWWKKSIAIDPNYARAYNNLGKALHDQKKLNEAIVCYKKAIAIDPTNTLAHNNLGHVLGDQKKVEEAINCFRKAISIDPKFAVGHANLGIALTTQNRLDEAVAHHQKALELDAKCALAHFGLGRCQYDQNKLDDAIAYYREAIRLQPDFASAYVGLGNALHGQKNLSDAIAAFNKAIEIDPKDPLAHNNLGCCHSDLKNLDAAIVCHREAIRLKPDYADAHFNLGNALDKQNRQDDAIAEYRTAIKIDPTFASAYYNLGPVLTKQKQLDEAIGCLRKYVKLAPKHPDGYYQLGVVLKNQGKLDEAIDWCKKAIAVDPGYADPHNVIGIALKRQKKLGEAIDWYKKAIALDPKNANFHYNLGIVLGARNNLDGAIAAYRQAIALNPQFAEPHYNLGNALAARNKPDEAIAAYREGIRLNPDHVSSHTNLGVALMRRGKLDEAAASFREAIRLKPNEPAAHDRLGRALAATGRVKEAIVSFEQAIRLNADYTRAHGNLAWLLTAGPDAKYWNGKRAVELMSQVEGRGGKNALSRRIVGLAHYRAGNWKESLVALEEALKLTEGDGYYWFCLAMAHQRLCHNAEARAWYDKAAEWMDRNKPRDTTGELRRSRAEAAKLLKVAAEVTPPTTEKK
jgi:tetratricopeptide (TPR) repeat protein/serine/threonine protein kinase